MHHSACTSATPGTMSKAAHAEPAEAAAPQQQRARVAWVAGSAVVGCALLLLAAAPTQASSGGGATSSRPRHGRESVPGARPHSGNQTTAAPPQERPATGTLQAWLANQTRALAAHGPVAAWDTSGETTLASVFQGAADFNEDLNAYVFWRARLCFLKLVVQACARQRVQPLQVCTGGVRGRR